MPTINELIDRTGSVEIIYALEDTEAREAIQEEADARYTQDQVLNARMDTFTNLPSGSTAGDAELADIRVGYDSTVYNSAGAAVRAQAMKPVLTNENTIKGFVNNGNTLQYDYDGLENAPDFDALIFGEPLPVELRYEKGSIENGVDTTRTDGKEWRSDYIKANGIPTITVAQDYRIIMFKYDNNKTYVSDQQFYAGTHNINLTSGYIRLKVNKNGWTAITAENANNAATLTRDNPLVALREISTFPANTPDLLNENEFYIESGNKRARTSLWWYSSETVYAEAKDKQWYSLEPFALDIDTMEQSSLTDGWAYSAVIPKRTPFQLRLRKNNDADITSLFEFLNNFSLQTEREVLHRNAENSARVAAAKKVFDSSSNANIESSLTFAHLTDIHSDDIRFHNFAKFVNETGAIDAAICTGDYVVDCSDAEITNVNNLVSLVKKPMYHTLGNHDRIGYTRTLTNTEVLSKYNFFTNGLYYSEMLSDKIMLIVLNQYQDESGSTNYGQTQIDWFTDQLETANENNYHVIIAMHEPEYLPEYNDNGFYQKYLKTTINSPVKNGMIQTIVNHYKNGVDLDEEYNGLTASATFPNEGIFVAFVCGHLHRELTGYAPQFTNQLVLAPVASACSSRTMSTAYNYTGNADLPRMIDGKTQDAFNVYSIDTANKLVKVVRIGSDINADFEERETTIFEY